MVAIQQYSAYLKQRSNTVASQVLGSADSIRHYYTWVVAGFAAGPLTSGQVAALRKHAGVRAVFPDQLFKQKTISTTKFLELDTIDGVWSQLGGAANAGEGVIVGVIDDGIWPEAPSFSDRSLPTNDHPEGEIVYDPVPSKWDGECWTGEEWTSSQCNLKLIGCKYFYAGMGTDAEVREFFPGEKLSCRNGYAESHGTHVAATAVGNNVDMTAYNGTVTWAISGMAPRARLAVYKVGWGDGGWATTTDVVAAYDAAAADGVDVISYSMAAPAVAPLFWDPIGLAQAGAAALGVSVVAAAGNGGPYAGSLESNTGPWLTTVAASSHHRGPLSAFGMLGDGNTFEGVPSSFASYQTLPMSQLILADAAAVQSGGIADARRCLKRTLRAAKASLPAARPFHERSPLFRHY
eukprot:gene7536-7746_t